MIVQCLRPLLNFNIKGVFINFLMILGGFFLPVIYILLTVGTMIAVDTIFALYKCHKKNILITSRGLSQMISKMVLYQSAVILFYIIEKYIMHDFVIEFTNIDLFLTKIIAMVLISIEIKSIDETFTNLYGYSMIKKGVDTIKRLKSIKDEVKVK